MKKNLAFNIFYSVVFAILFGIFLRFNYNFFYKIGFDFNFLKLIGDLFLNLVKMISIPLVFFSVADSIISVEGFSKSGKIIYRGILVFLVTTIFCVLLGVISLNYFNIGKITSLDYESIISKNALPSLIINRSNQDYSFSHFLFDIIPSNIFESFLKGNFLQIIFFSIIIGVSILKLDEDVTGVKAMIKSLSNITMKSIQIVMKFAPVGIFGTTSWLFATQDVKLISSLGIFIIFNYLNAFFVMFFCYGALILFVLKLNPIHFFRKIKAVQVLAYFTDSTAVTMPTAMEVAKKKLGISEEKVNLIMPIGMTVNMNGGALYLGACALFLAQIFSIKLTFYKYLTIIVMSTLSAIGTAPVPGASILLLGGIITSIGVPIEAIAIIFPVDRILDMIRTVVNVTGDTVAAMTVDKFSGTFNKELYKSKN